MCGGKKDFGYCAGEDPAQVAALKEEDGQYIYLFVHFFVSLTNSFWYFFNISVMCYPL